MRYSAVRVDGMWYTAQSRVSMSRGLEMPKLEDALAIQRPSGDTVSMHTGPLWEVHDWHAFPVECAISSSDI